MNDAASQQSPIRRWLIIATVMAAMLMQMLDMTIANVALPHMQAALGATPEGVIWVLTSYILMSAVATPIAGWLETKMGRQRLFIISILGFTFTSALCGMAVSLEMMVAARALQGLFGAFIVPLGQATMIDCSPPEKRAQSLMILTIGLTTSPILGPVLGGWITDSFGWRWVFYINVPVGLAAAAGVWLLIDNTKLPQRRFDLVGFAFLSIGLASLQLMLDRGSQLDWFDSPEILIEAGLCISMLWMFVVHSLTTSNPLIPADLFKDRNFILATFFLMLSTGIGYAGISQMGTMLQVLFNYDPTGAGIILAPRGIGSLIAMPIVTPLSNRVDARYLIAAGFGMVIASLWLLSGLELGASHELVVLAGFVQGLGFGFSFLPLTLMSFATLEPHLRTEGAAVSNLARNLTGSVSISLIGALFVRNVQVSHSDLVVHITPMNVPLLDSRVLSQTGNVGAMALQMVDAEINRQAAMIAYLDNFWITMWIALITFPLIIFLRTRTTASKAPVMMME